MKRFNHNELITSDISIASSFLPYFGQLVSVEYFGNRQIMLSFDHDNRCVVVEEKRIGEIIFTSQNGMPIIDIDAFIKKMR